MNFKSTEHPIIWFRDEYQAGRLFLKPPFQRQPVWLAKQKCSLIESILFQLPVPEVYIQHEVITLDDQQTSRYSIVDGQQRIRTVLQFLGVDRTETELEFNGFSLDKLPADSPYKDKNFQGLSPEQKTTFLDYGFAGRYLRDADDNAVRDMFRRLNKNLTKLNDQEIRNATYTGAFMKAVAQLAEKTIWVERGLVSPMQVRRMKDIEFASELLIGVIHGPQGGSAKKIDDFYRQYEEFDDEFPGQAAALQRFEETLSTVLAVVPHSGVSRFRSNRTDFYTLFVVVAQLLRTKSLKKSQQSALRSALTKFEVSVDKHLADEKAASPAAVIKYVRAVEKGANDKQRRADRHQALQATIEQFFD